MIKLPPIEDKILELHYKKQKKKYEKVLNDLYKASACPKITNYFFSNGQLDENKVKTALIGNPAQLKLIIKNIGEIPTSCKSTVHDKFLNLYDNFKGRSLGKSLCDDIGVKVCPYCNRSYIFTLNRDGVRPQYDHFYSKMHYPYLAVSIYNLIPSCSICNQAKSAFDTYKEPFINPYTDEYGYDIFFETKFNGDISYLLGKNTNFKLNINCDNASTDMQIKAQNSIRELHTQELYSKHKDYVRDIIRAKQIYTDEYMQNLLSQFPQIFDSIADIQQMAYMNYLNKDQWGDRILAKLTYDIVHELQ